MIFDRTFHPDEANQAFTTGRLLETGHYAYNPADHHGPTLYYAAAPVQRLCGATGTASLEELPLRCVPLAFAVLTLVFAFMALRRLSYDDAKRHLPKHRLVSIGAALLSLLPLATLPILFFYSTYFIQETLLGCFLTGMLWCGIEYAAAVKARAAGVVDAGRRRLFTMRPCTWAVFFGVFAGLAFATKETSVIAFLSAAIAATPLPLLRRLDADRSGAKRQVPDARTAPPPPPAFLTPLALAALSFLLTSVLLFSSFATNWHGLYAAFIEAPLSYLGRANGSAASAGAADHVHEWWWYLKVLFGHKLFHLRWIAALFVLAPVLTGCFRPPRPVAFLYLYTVVSFVVYSAIPYKTPWCMLTVAEAMALAAGAALAVPDGRRNPSFKDLDAIPIWKRVLNGPLGMLAAILLVALTVKAQISTCTRINRYPDNPMIPYNYANASWDVKQAAAACERACAKSGDGAWIAVCLPADSLWPLPWYLRKATAGYWPSIDALPSSRDSRPAAVVVPADDSYDRARLRFPELDTDGIYGIRPGVLCNVLYRD